MSNKDVAVNWARQQVATGRPVISDAFFKPFNEKQQSRVRGELSKFNIVAWPLPKGGAFLCDVRDPRFKVNTDGTISVALWCDEAKAQIITLPAIYTKTATLIEE